MSLHRAASGALRPLSPIRMILTVVAVLSAGSASPDSALGLGARVQFDEADVRLVPGVTGTSVSMDGTLRAGGDTTPELPMEVRVFRVPDGFEVAAVHATPLDEVRVASGIRLAVREEAIESNDPADARRAFPAGALVEGAPTLPAEYAVDLGAGDMAGYRLHSVAVFPLRWEASTGDLILTTAMDLSLDLVPSTETTDLVRERHNPEAERAFAEAVRAIVANPEDVIVPAGADSYAAGRALRSGGFAPMDLPSTEGSAVDMVIVTTDAMASAFQVLADWKTQKGVPAVVRTVQWIDANYPYGNDRAERVRMFLQDAYTKWGTYLLLVGGDFDKVVPRLAFNRFFFQGTHIPTDQYFACLNGNWNADGDELIGEGLYQGTNDDQADLYPELFVGRASVDNATEVQTFVDKSFTYDKNPPAGYVEDVCYLAEVLFPSDWEYGDPPEIVTLDGSDLTDEFDLLIPPSWTRTKRYQINNTLDRSIALSELSGGHHHLVTLMNHGDAFKFSAGNGLNPLVYRADMDTLSNGDYLMFVMATACNPNQIDLECAGESFMNNPNGGAIAVLGPTREDFPLSASAYHRAMLSLVFDSKVTRFGMFNQVHRVPFIPLTSTDATPDRWTMMTKELLGDPELRFWTEEPGQLLASHATNVPLGTTSITVTVTDALATPVPDALVCVSDANGTYARGRTDGAGVVALPLSSSQSGTVDVVASAPEFKPSETTFAIDPAAGAVVALSGVTIDDDGVGNSNGNGDGTIDAGETVELDVTMHNGGGATATGVSLTGSIEAGSSATFDLLWDGVRDETRVFVGPDRVNPASVPFTLDFASPAIDYIGTPFLSFAADSVSGTQGIFLWQDLEGWHLRWNSGSNTIPVTGVVTTDGRVRGVFAPDLEVTDSATISAGEDSLSIAGTTGPQDLADGVDFALADNTMLTMTSPVVVLGDITASSSASGKVAFSVSPTARDMQIAYVDFAATSALRSTWSSETAVAIAGPELEAILLTVEDGSVPPVSGDGDGVVEVGETVRVTPTVLNRGSGYAGAVSGSATAVSGISFVDPSDAYGDIARLTESAGTDGYVFTVNDSTGTTIDLTLTDSLGRSWVKSIDFMAPAAPDSMDFESSSDMILVFWDPSPEPDVAGYNIYRSLTEGSGHVKQNADLIRAGSRYEDAGLALGAEFYYYATAVDSSGNEGAASSEIYGYTTQVQVPGWPQTANSNIFSSLAIADADGTGNDEVYVGSQDFKFYGWASDGSTLPGFPLEDANSQIWSTPALADLDGDGDLEIMYGASDNRLYVVHHDGTPVFPPNPWILDLGIGNQLFRGAVSVGDVDNDNELEFFAGTDGGTIYAFNADGTGLTDPSGLFYGPMGAGSQTGPLVWGPVAIADWDGNGTTELAFAAWNDSLYVVNADGTNFPGFPKGHRRQHKNGPVFADLDNDNTMELIVGCSDSTIYVYNHDGTGYMGGSPVFADMPDQVISMPVPCQLDADPELELVVTCFDGNCYAFNHDGSGFLQPGGLFAEINEPAEDDHITASPIVVDVDGDGSFEIFFGHRNFTFYGFHSDGSTITGMPIKTPKNIFSTAAAGDLDHDGDVDVAFASYDTFVYVLDFAGASTPAAYEWPTYGGNNMRQNAYGSVDNVTGVSSMPGAAYPFSLSQNSPNPFGAATSIHYSVPRDMPLTLRIYNVEGRLVRTLVNGAVPAGPGQADWDGRDTSGARLSSGVYFYRMQAGDDAVTRKSLLLR